MGECYDCKRPYGSAGFPDLIIPNDAWRQISPSGDEGGLLCPTCMIARLHISGIVCEGAFMSGPITSVSRELMTTIRWVENLREQGHGWGCPKCGERRDPPASKNQCGQTEERSDDDAPAAESLPDTSKSTLEKLAAAPVEVGEG